MCECVKENIHVCVCACVERKCVFLSDHSIFNLERLISCFSCFVVLLTQLGFLRNPGLQLLAGFGICGGGGCGGLLSCRDFLRQATGGGASCI